MIIKTRSRKRGQSVVELIVTLFAFFTVVFMFVQVALGFGVANYFQYATFMAARALYASDLSEGTQKAAAERVLDAMTKKNGGDGDRFPGIAESNGQPFVGATNRVTLGVGTSGSWPASARNNTWEQGVTFGFKIRMYMMPLVQGSKRGSANRVELESESWLGRETSEIECQQQLARKQGAQRTFLYDNGC